ncbi:MAG: Electron transfer flavoprotein subunit beta [Chloroflexi bacterium ADurb.Bin325]|nr:MAG: Electron transfer flavoprotein subunit beta [Chloroflexi bacterium ADurb.Bin325]
MKFVVCVKLTPDTEQLTEVRPQDVGTDDLGVTMVMNPWDEFAVEEALSLQERYDGETTVLTVGGEESVEALRWAVAMGVEETVLLSDPAFADSDAWGVAHILAQAIRRIDGYKLVLTGKQSVDGNSGMVGPGLAAELGAPFIANVVKILDLTEDSITVRRMLDEGIQTVRVALPAVITVSIEINEPRYRTFLGIRKAAKLAYPATAADALPGLDMGRVGAQAGLVRWTNLRKPPERGGKVEFIEGGAPAEQAARLADKLIAGKVI